MAAAKVPLIEAASKGELGQVQALLAKDLGSVDTTHNGQVCGGLHVAVERRPGHIMCTNIIARILYASFLMSWAPCKAYFHIHTLGVD